MKTRIVIIVGFYMFDGPEGARNWKLWKEYIEEHNYTNIFVESDYFNHTYRFIIHNDDLPPIDEGVAYPVYNLGLLRTDGDVPYLSIMPRK